MEFGNLSFAVGGLILLALLLEERSPVTTGVLLGASLLVKPLAPAAVLTLLFDRTRPGRWHWLAATVAVLFAGLPLLADPELAAFVTKGSSVWAIDRTVSLHRFLALSDHREAARLLTIVLLLPGRIRRAAIRGRSLDASRDHSRAVSPPRPSSGTTPSS
ncbi:MAG: glycosyltransferase 87 family protein [Thermoanaerobaculia bacterium]